MKKLISALLILPTMAFASPEDGCEKLFSGYPVLSEAEERTQRSYETFMTSFISYIHLVHYDRLVEEADLFNTPFADSEKYEFEFEAAPYSKMETYKAEITRKNDEILGLILSVKIIEVESGDEHPEFEIQKKSLLEAARMYSENPEEIGDFGKYAILAQKYMTPFAGPVVKALAQEFLAKKEYEKIDSEYKYALNRAYADYFMKNNLGYEILRIALYFTTQPRGYSWTTPLEYDTLYINVKNELVIEGRYFNTIIKLEDFDPQAPTIYFDTDGKKSSLSVTKDGELINEGDWDNGAQWSIIFDIGLFVSELENQGKIEEL